MDEQDREFWDREFRDDPDHVNVEDQFLDAVLATLEPGTALDLGCGRGLNALALARRGWSVLGVDISDRAVELAKEAAAEEALDADFLTADCSEWDPPRRFDLVISTYALPGGAKSDMILANARRALAPGGTLVVVEWDRSMAEIWQFKEEEMTPLDRIVRCLTGLSIEEAEIRSIEAFEPDDPRAHAGTRAKVAFVRASVPMAEG